jgi:ectoine hydroxylase-related dioxygenase (phytanoyl-CoA dioxygenase family)
MLVKRKILRHFTKNNVISSRAHIDYSYLDRGSKSVLTAWVPMGNSYLETGGLVYLQDSHHLSFNELKEEFGEFKEKFWITDDLKELSDRTNKKWLYSNFSAGDVVLHSPYIIHASIDCRSDYMRISSDIRFIPTSEELDPRWSADWSANDGY